MELQPQKDIPKIVGEFMAKSKPEDRYASFDYCYNYFRTTDQTDLINNMEKSCLTLGFYLASWGMFRKGFLRDKSLKHYDKTIEYIASLDKNIWEIDVDKYTEENIKIILDIYAKIKDGLVKKGSADLTLVTKVMLGVFGFIPAFDKYFCDTFRQIFEEEKHGFRKVNSKSLTCIKRFYDINKSTIDNISNQTFTIDFLTEKKTNINYPKAKIVDMYGFKYSLKK